MLLTVVIEFKGYTIHTLWHTSRDLIDKITVCIISIRIMLAYSFGLLKITPRDAMVFDILFFTQACPIFV